MCSKSYSRCYQYVTNLGYVDGKKKIQKLRTIFVFTQENVYHPITLVIEWDPESPPELYHSLI